MNGMQLHDWVTYELMSDLNRLHMLSALNIPGFCLGVVSLAAIHDTSVKTVMKGIAQKLSPCTSLYVQTSNRSRRTNYNVRDFNTPMDFFHRSNIMTI